MSVVTQTLLDSELPSEFELIHLDTADRRSLSNVGRLDFRNCALALLHGYRFLYLLLRHWPDLVYLPIAQNSLGFLRDSLFLLPALLLGRPVAIHLHGSAFRGFYNSAPGPIRFLVRLTLSRVALAIVYSERLLPVFSGLVEEDRIRFVENGIGNPLAIRASKPGAGGGSAPSILFIGALTEAKGLMVLLEAMAAVWKAHPEARLVLCGEFRSEELAGCFEQFVEDLDAADLVELAGVVSEEAKEGKLEEAWVLACPSTAPEGQPLVILEAMARSVPVVASAVGAIPDAVEDGSTGYLVSPGDASGLAERLSDLIGDSQLRAAMGAAARERFEQRYTAEAWAGRMSSVFRSVLN
jgi:glycosyltransferase involved in cell wall biosynthesis